jgi:hypothetical protein
LYPAGFNAFFLHVSFDLAPKVLAGFQPQCMYFQRFLIQSYPSFN